MNTRTRKLLVVAIAWCNFITISSTQATTNLHLTATTHAAPSASARIATQPNLPEKTTPVAVCTPISTLDCSSIGVGLPFALTFNSTEGGLTDNASNGTGFTMVMHPSAPLNATTDPTIGTPADAAVPGYVPSKLTVNAGALTIASNKGLFFKCNAAGVSSNTNSQINALGVGFNANNGTFRIKTTIAQPNFSASSDNSSQQGGIWFGLDENRVAKIVIFKTGTNTGRIQVQVENINNNCTGVPASLPELNTADNIINNTQNITLILELNPSASTARGFYQINGGAETQVGGASGSLAVPSSFFTGVDHDANGATGALSYAGIFASHRNATQSMNFVFNDFSIAPTNASPTIANASFALYQNVANGYQVGTVTANDPENTTLSYAITAGNTGNVFAISNSGVITVADNTNLTVGTYTLTVQATDSGTPSASASATVIITSLGIGAPANNFTELKINFQNESPTPPAGYEKDFGQPFSLKNNGLTYGWVVPGTATPLNLAVGGTTPGNGRNRAVGGVDILLNTLLHMQADDIANFNGTAAEGAWEIAIVNGRYNVQVSVGDPTVDQAADVPTHRINAEGVNLINNYIPTGGVGSATRFTSGTGVVGVTDDRLTLDATGGGFNTKINYVIITPYQNQAPVVANAIVNQDATTGQVFNFAIPANTFNDPDAYPNAMLTLTATQSNGTPLPGWLSFNGSAFTGTPMAGDVGTLTIKVTASDGAASVFDEFDLIVAAANQPPVVVANQSFSIDIADVEDGAVIGTVAATDDNNNITGFAIIAGNEQNYFAIDNNGQLTIGDHHVPVNTYNLTIQATDGSGLPGQGVVQVVITNLTPNQPPILAGATYNVLATVSNGYQIAQISATDPDGEMGDPPLTYLIHHLQVNGGANIPGNTQTIFAIGNTSGILTLTNVSQIAVGNTYLLHIHTTDGDGGTGEAFFTVNIVAPAAPTINPQTFNVVEGSPSGTVVGSVIANTADGNITNYAITGAQFLINPAIPDSDSDQDPQYNAATVFSLNANTGVLTVNNPKYLLSNLDPIQLTVQVTDNNNLTATATITVNVSDKTVSIAQNPAITWTLVAAHPVGHSEGTGGVVNGKLYVFGGFNPNFSPKDDVHVYNPLTNTWTQLADMPPMSTGTTFGGATHMGWATDGTDIYIAAGYAANSAGTGQVFGSTRVYRYNVAANNYTELSALPTNRSAGALAYLAGKLYYVGGTNLARTEDQGDLLVLDLNNQAAGWQALAPMPNPRNHIGSTVFDGKLYIFGGQQEHDGELVPQDDVHSYDPVTNTWTHVTDMPLAFNHIHCSVFTYGEYIFTVGGQIAHGSGARNEVYAYHPSTDTWIQFTNLPIGRFATVAGVINGKLYASGGSGSSATATYTAQLPTQFEVIDPTICAPISTLNCDDIAKTIPYNLTFNGTEGGLIDNTTDQTGFAMVLHPSQPLLVDAGNPANVAVPGYVPAKLDVTGGNLVITASKGLFYRDNSVSTNTNSQINALGVGFNAATGKKRIQTTLVNPAFNLSAGDNNSQQAGLWFGLNDNNVAKLALVKTGATTAKVQLVAEDYVTVTNNATAPLELNTGNLPGNITTQTITLILEIDPATLQCKGFYKIGNGAEVAVTQNGDSDLALGSHFFTGTDHDSDAGTPTISYTGVFGSLRNAAATPVINFNFADFSIAPLNQPPLANAGNDQILTDTDGNNSEAVMLDGSASTDADGTIATYVWTENSVQIATGVTPTVNFAVGSHTVTLTVTDNLGATATDQVLITVNGSTPQSVVSPAELVFDGVKNTTIGPKTITVQNTGTGVLQIQSVTTVGNNNTLFNATPTGITVNPAQSTTISVNFVPGNNVGALNTNLQITTNDPVNPIKTVGLYGLSTNGLEGGNEPALQNVVNTLGYGITVGWTGLTTGQSPATTTNLLGDEVSVQFFQKAGSGPVTLLPVARYSPQEFIPFGYYTKNNGTPVLNEVGVLLNGSPHHQTLYPGLASGGTSFDPGAAQFGIYTDSDVFNRVNYTEDALNVPSGVTRRARVYPLKNRQGNPIPNSYLIAYEDATNGDYQDYVFVISNVQPASANQAPVVDNQTFNVTEGSPNGTVVGTVVATDDVAVTNYSITAGNGLGIFTINPSTGVITVANNAALTVANGPVTLTVEVSDAQNATDNAQMTININAAVACTPLSLLPCPQIKVNLPFSLEFTGNEGGLNDASGNKTGFTMVDPPSARIADDGATTYANVPGYEPSRLTIANGKLNINAAKGIAFLKPPGAGTGTTSANTNSQINTLGVAFDADNSSFELKTTLVNPYADGSNNSEQAGLWFGINENNYVKLVFNNGNQVELRREIGSNSDNVDQVLTTSLGNQSNNTLTLRLRIDLTNNTIAGFYKINNNAEVALVSTLPLPAAFLNGATVNGQAVSFGGVFATKRNEVAATQVVYMFENFSITPDALPAPALSFGTNPLTTSLQQGASTTLTNTIDASDDGEPTVNFSVQYNNSSGWLSFPAAQDITSGNTVNFTFNANGLAPGVYQAVVTASANGYTNATFTAQLTVTGNAFAGAQINFQDPGTTPPTGYLRDSGEPYGVRNGANQGSGQYTYGWVVPGTSTPLNLSIGGSIPGNGRNRNVANLSLLLNTLMHMQADDVSGTFNGTAAEGAWEIQVPNGTYEVTVHVGDPNVDQAVDAPIHRINAEGVNVINNYVPTGAVGAATRFSMGMATVQVTDGRLTLDATGGGKNTKINYVRIQPSNQTPRPAVVGVNPVNGATNVAITTSVSANQLFLPNPTPQGSGIDNTTLTSNVKLFKVVGQTETEIPSGVNGTGGGDAITLTPNAPLEVSTTYRFVITDGVRDLSGASMVPFSSIFTTQAQSGGGTPTTNLDNVAFTKVATPVATGAMYTSLVIGPDSKFYGLTLGGEIHRWTINTDGTLANKQVITTLNTVFGARSAIGLAFDPASTANNLIAYVTHTTGGLSNQPDWEGKLSRLTGANLENHILVLTNLPRSARDHLTNSIAFGTDGKLYFLQGSNSAGGQPDGAWGNREESLLSAACLRLDFSKMPPENQWPLDVITKRNFDAIKMVDVNAPTLDGEYNPYYLNAPLTIFASGIRNAYDLLWHTNGQLYIPTNGTAGGSNTPASINGMRRPNGTFYNHNDPNYPVIPGTNNNNVQRDWLFRVDPSQPIGYYGHPNPYRGEFVLNRGKTDVNNYPVGIVPDVNYRGAAFDFEFNKSPNGVIEYRSNAEAGNLRGAILVVRYSGGDDIIALVPDGPNGNIQTFKTGIPGFTGFADPLDLIEDINTGNIYVSEFGASKITLVKPNRPATVQTSGTIVVTPEKLYFTQPTGAGATASQVVTIRNVHPTLSLQVSNVALGGANAAQYSLVAGGLPVTLQPNEIYTFTVNFDPTTEGSKPAEVVITSNDGVSPTKKVLLQGLGTDGLGGANEPSLQYILDAYLGAGVVNVGDNDPATNPINAVENCALLGSEVNVESFEKAAQGPVTLELISVFGPTSSNPIVRAGWYTAGNANSVVQLFDVDNTPTSNGQTLAPPINTGALSFDPGTTAFGFYSEWPFFGNRRLFSQDNLNTTSPSANSGCVNNKHHVRVYPLPGESNAYIIATEEHTSGYDYQDIVFIARNIKPAGSLIDNSPPSVAIQLTGNEVNYLVYEAQAGVTILAEDLGGSGINKIEYRVQFNNGAFGAWTTYTAPFTLNQPGAYTLEARAMDNAGNTSEVAQLVFSIIPTLSNAIIRVENMTKIPGTQIGFPADTCFAFSRILNPVGTGKNHETNTLRIHNDGTENLVVNGVTLANTTDWDWDLPGGIENPTLPITILPGQFQDIVLQFIKTSGGKNIYSTKLDLESNAKNGFTKVVDLRGAYMTAPEGGNELNAQLLVDVFGFRTDIRTQIDDNGNIIAPSPSPSSAYPDPDDVNAGLHGDLVLSEFWTRANQSQPVRGFYLAAYHGPGTTTTALANANNSNIFSFTHASDWYQSLLPKSNNTLTGPIAGNSENPTGSFKLKTQSQTTSGLNNQTLLGIRVYKVYDKNGNVVPNHYISIHDNIGSGCGQGSANCDWNDDMIYWVNVRPVGLPSVQNIPDQTVDAGINFTFNVATYFNNGYPGNTLKYSALVNGTEPLPTWLTIDPVTGIFSGTPPIEDLVPISITVTAMDCNGLTVSDVFVLTIDLSDINCSVTATIQDNEKITCDNPEVTLVGNTSTGTYAWYNEQNILIGTTASINVSAPGKYYLRVPPSSTTIKVNFQDQATTVPSGFLKDYGQAYDLRTAADQGNSTYTYGWVAPGTTTPRNLAGNGRNRPPTPDQNTLIETLMHMDYMGTAAGSVAQPGAWEMALPNGIYQVKVTAGDLSLESTAGTRHLIRVEGVTALDFFSFPTGGTALTTNLNREGTVIVGVGDGRLTIDAIGGFNTKINAVEIRPVDCPIVRLVEVSEDKVEPTVQINASTPNLTCAQPEVTLSGNGSVYQPGATFEWVTDPLGPGNIVSGANTLTAKVNTAAFYSLIITNPNGCEEAVSIQIGEDFITPPNAGNNGTYNICNNATPIELFDILQSLGGTPDAGGTWTQNGQPTDAIFDPQTDVAGDYVYSVGGLNGCPVATATVTINIQNGPNPGTSTTTTVCATDQPINLLTLLNGDAGGTWTINGQATDALFNPQTDAPGIYTYTVVGTGACTTPAVATVTVGVEATPNAGGNATATLCPTGAPVNLFTYLTGTPAGNGTWSFNNQPTDGIFDPSTDLAGVYTYTVTGTVCAAATATVTITFDPAACDPCALPQGWSNTDIGAVAAVGSVCYNATTQEFEVKGSGVDIFDSSDEFQYVYQTLNCDGEIIARVTLNGTTHPWAKAAVMIRASVNPNSPHAMMVMANNPIGGGAAYSFQHRLTTGGLTQYTNPVNASLPRWIRVARVGNTITGYISVNGTTWTQVGTPVTINMGTSYLIGLAVTAHNDGQINTAKFDNVKILSPNAGENGTAILCPTGTAVNLFDYLGGTPTLSGTWTFNGQPTDGIYDPKTEPAGVYTYAITGSNCGGNSATVTVTLDANICPNCDLPAGWTNVDIGAVGAAGSICYTAATGQYEVKGSGADIFGTVDEFQYVYQTLDCDGEITARVTMNSNTHPWAKAGVMIRASNSANSAHAMMILANNPSSTGSAYSFQNRLTTGGITNFSAPVNAALPHWVRIKKEGNLLTGFVSNNGVNWTQVGSVTINLGATYLIGLAVTSHNDGVINTAKFDNVNLIGCKAALHGSLTLQGRTDHSATVAVKLYEPGTANLVTTLNATTNAAGNFTLPNLPPGTYDMYVKKDNYLQKKLADVVLTSGATTLANFGELLAGDANNDNYIDIFDYGIFLSAFFNGVGDPGYSEAADFNGDGFVDISDYGLFFNNFFLAGDEPPIP